MIKILHNQPVPIKRELAVKRWEKIGLIIVALNNINQETRLGDCLEVDFNPEGLRQYINKVSNYDLLIIEIDINVWRIWKKVIE